MGQMRERLLGRRIEHVLALAAAAVHPLAVDVEREIGIHGAPRWSRHCRDISWRRISIFRGWIHPSSRLRSHSKRSQMPNFAAAIVERWNSPQKRPAVHLDVLPGNEARVGTAEEAHGGGDV